MAPSGPSSDAAGRPGRATRPLITAADIQRLAAGSRLDLPGGALVTPAARDAAFVRDIELRPAGPEEAPDPGPRGTWSVPDLARLGDGTWLVEVRGSTARVRRVEP